MFISLKVISVLLKKRNRRDEKEGNKKKNKVMTLLDFGGLCIFA